VERGQNARKKVRVETFLQRESKGGLWHRNKVQCGRGDGWGPVASACTTRGLKITAHGLVPCLQNKRKHQSQGKEDCNEGDNNNQHTPKWGKGGMGIWSPRPQSLVGGGGVWDAQEGKKWGMGGQGLWQEQKKLDPLPDFCFLPFFCKNGLCLDRPRRLLVKLQGLAFGPQIEADSLFLMNMGSNRCIWT
jgi:hypothetical protein